jgi:hypothetical protein
VHERSATRDGITSSAPTLPSSRSPAVKDTELPLPPSVPSAPSATGADAALYLGSDDNACNDDGDSDSDSDDAAPEVMSAKRPPGIVAYGSSSDAELEKPHAVNDQPGPTFTSSSRSGPDAVSASQQSSLPKAESANRPRRAPPPQPKKPPRNPFAARPSLLRNVSESIIAVFPPDCADGCARLFIAFAARDSCDCVQSLPGHPFPGRE